MLKQSTVSHRYCTTSPGRITATGRMCITPRNKCPQLRAAYTNIAYMHAGPQSKWRYLRHACASKNAIVVFITLGPQWRHFLMTALSLALSVPRLTKCIISSPLVLTQTRPLTTTHTDRPTDRQTDRQTKYLLTTSHITNARGIHCTQQNNGFLPQTLEAAAVTFHIAMHVHYITCQRGGLQRQQRACVGGWPRCLQTRRLHFLVGFFIRVYSHVKSALNWP